MTVPGDTMTETAARGSCLYHARVMHKRLRPFVHRFDYRVFTLLLDIDELPDLDRRLRGFSYNRANLLSFWDRDHGPRDGTPLRPWIEGHLARAGIDIAGGPVRLLCFPRLLGYVFNPLSIWFCNHPTQGLQAILYEVRNTFGESHSYLIPVAADQRDGRPIVQACDKRFYVSPFIEMESDYRFRLREPDERLSVLIRQAVREGEILLATMTGRRVPLTATSLLRAAIAFPLMTQKVIVAIHWQALRLWLKGARPVPRPKQSEPEPLEQRPAAWEAAE